MNTYVKLSHKKLSTNTSWQNWKMQKSRLAVSDHAVVSLAQTNYMARKGNALAFIEIMMQLSETNSIKDARNRCNLIKWICYFLS